MTRSSLFLYTLVIVCVVLCAALIVSRKASSQHYSPTSVATSGPYTLQVQMASAEAKVLKPNTFTVSVREANNTPVRGASVSIAISMPDMFCGVSTAQAEEVEPGIYRGEGIPLMAGRSSAEVSVALNGHKYTIEHPFLSVR
ncbi:FixH family protein [Paenibacillus rigui]|nr:FixH family protein [Paenibacillus rigui]